MKGEIIHQNFNRQEQDMDPKSEEAMLGIVVLDTANLDPLLSKEYREESENVVRLVSIALQNDRLNAMEQNHLVNHYFYEIVTCFG